MVVVSRAEVSEAAERVGVAGTPVCLHASLRSFPRLDAGPETLVEGLLDTGATVMVATMANHAFAIPAPLQDRPPQNALDYGAEDDRARSDPPPPGLSRVYDPACTEVDSWLGATSAYVVQRSDRVRCRRPTGQLTAVGPLAEHLIDAEVEDDMFGPLRALATCDGTVLLAGVGLTSMTLLHVAEVEAGRRPFIRWAFGPDGNPVRSRGGECSKGFEALSPALEVIERRTTVGDSLWRVYPAAEAIELAAEAIRANPQVTRCDTDGCIDCADALAGGPIEEADGP